MPWHIEWTAGTARYFPDGDEDEDASFAARKKPAIISQVARRADGSAYIHATMSRSDATAGSWLFPSRGRSGHIEQKAVGVAVWAHRPASSAHPEWERPRLVLDDWAPHDLRRTGRTMLAALGCPAEVAEAILGHLLPGIVGTYNLHTYDAERRQWLTRLSAHLESCAGQTPVNR